MIVDCKCLVSMRTQFVVGSLVLLFLVAVNGVPVSDNAASMEAESKESSRLLSRVSDLLTEDALVASAKLANARAGVTDLEKRLTKASMGVAKSKQLLQTTKTKFDQFVGDHNSCLLDLQTLDQAGLVSLKRLGAIKSHLNKLTGIISNPANGLFKVETRRPRDKLASKLSTFIDTIVSRIGEHSKTKKASCDQIHAVIEEENGLRKQSIDATAAVNTAEDLFYYIQRKLLALKKMIRLLEEQDMNKKLNNGKERAKVSSLQSEIGAMQGMLKRSTNCTILALQIGVQSQRTEAAIDSLVSVIQNAKKFQGQSVIQSQLLVEEATSALDRQKADLDQFKLSVERYEQKFRVLASEGKSDKQRCLVNQSVRRKEAAVLEKLIELITKLANSNKSKASRSQIMGLLQAVRPIAGKVLRTELELIQAQKPNEVSVILKMLQSVRSRLAAAESQCNQLQAQLTKKVTASERVFTMKKAKQDVLQSAVRKSEATLKAAQEALNQAQIEAAKVNESAREQTELLHRVKPIFKGLAASERAC